MFNLMSFDKEINHLLREGSRDEAEQRMLEAHEELTLANNLPDLEYVISRLAHFHATPGVENLEKAERYFLESEALLPNVSTKYQTAMFYYYVLRDPSKTLDKINEITPSLATTDLASYYSALAVKGQALIDLQMQGGTIEVLKETLNLVKANRAGLPYGDEQNLLQSAISNRLFRPLCREILQLVIPRMRSHEYAEKAKELLRLSARSEG